LTTKTKAQCFNTISYKGIFISKHAHRNCSLLCVREFRMQGELRNYTHKKN
jgi:hypothetical protein